MPSLPVTVNEARLMAMDIRSSRAVDNQYWPFVIEELCNQIEELRSAAADAHQCLLAGDYSVEARRCR